jgi:hypothetical protein
MLRTVLWRHNEFSSDFPRRGRDGVSGGRGRGLGTANVAVAWWLRVGIGGIGTGTGPTGYTGSSHAAAGVLTA